MRTNIKISKIDAVKRQIQCAITLYFNDGDLVSNHTLTAAAYNILLALNKGEAWMAKDQIKKYVKDGKEKEVKDLFNRAENFFKHGSRDRDCVLDFNPELTEILLWECCSIYRQLTGESPKEMICFNIWFKIKHDSLFIYTDEERHKADEATTFVAALSKKKYFDLTLLALNQFPT